MPRLSAMDVITTHVNADFDCLGAMVAARKLYPGARMVFSGSQEKSMRDLFLKSSDYHLDFTRLKDLDLALVTRLILVDCQHSSRIGRFAEILGRPGLTVHIYDHHPEATGDIPPAGGMIRDCGSTTTILTTLLRQQGIPVTPVEATLMMLGIYEDTGSLTFPTTSGDDYLAAAWLLEQGANLKTVAEFIVQELTADQVALLNELLESLRTLTVNGIDVAIAHASREYYVGDVAVLAHMMRDMEGLDALFLVIGMGDRVYLVGRSRIPEVDVGAVLRQLEGGGHATAASATLKDVPVIQALEKLEGLLRTTINPQRLAGDIMSAPVKTVPRECSIAEAREQLTRYNVNALPVMDGGRMVGIISRRIVEKALYHGLGDLPVSEYMHTEYLRVTPATPIAEIQEYIVGQNRRFVPVFSGEELVGAVTRTDILRSILASEAPYDLGREKIPVRSKEIAALMNRHLSPRTLQILRDLGRVGEELGLPVYAVGGFVRDLLLGSENLDVDITVEGDGIVFAETCATAFGCRVRSHRKFGTAVIVFADGFKVDVASTRLEYYTAPGALPVVERSSLKLDLYRRDFTINTLAIQLNTPRFGLLVDYYGAQRDLQEKVIRVLHNLSFVEDPTRVFRAIRFEQRLRFHIARHTENLIKNAVKMNFLEKLGGKRLLTELILILQEKGPEQAIERLDSFGLLRFIHNDLQLTPEIRSLLETSSQIVSWFDLLFLEHRYERWVVYFLALGDGLSDEQFCAACIRLMVREHYREKLCDVRRTGRETLERLERRLARRQKLLRSEVYHELQVLPTEVQLYLMARTRSAEVKKVISLYFTHLQGIRTSITGDDLTKLGLRPGPCFREILDRILQARLNGEVQSQAEELRLAEELVQEC